MAWMLLAQVALCGRCFAGFEAVLLGYDAAHVFL
jgi:hypothetical protein